jgi:hypothetical protein
VSDDGFLRGHRVARIVGIAVPLTLFLVWWAFSGGRGEITSISEVSALVLSDDGRTCLVRIDSGEQVRVFKPRDAKAGSRLRMRRTLYDNGDVRFDPVASIAPVGAE